MVGSVVKMQLAGSCQLNEMENQSDLVWDGKRDDRLPFQKEYADANHWIHLAVHTPVSQTEDQR